MVRLALWTMRLVSSSSSDIWAWAFVGYRNSFCAWHSFPMVLSEHIILVFWEINTLQMALVLPDRGTLFSVTPWSQQVSVFSLMTLGLPQGNPGFPWQSTTYNTKQMDSSEGSFHLIPFYTSVAWEAVWAGGEGTGLVLWRVGFNFQLLPLIFLHTLSLSCLFRL